MDFIGFDYYAFHKCWKRHIHVPEFIFFSEYLDTLAAFTESFMPSDIYTWLFAIGQFLHVNADIIIVSI